MMEKRLFAIMGKAWLGMLFAALLGALAVGSNVFLLGLSAYLISAAALHPSITELSTAIVGVRFFGISRAILRYLERYVSHDVTFRLLEYLRVWFYRRLEPLAPAALSSERSGELLSAIVGDVETLRDFYLRAIAPPVIAFLVLAGICSFLISFSPWMAGAVIGAFFTVGFLLPWVLRTFRQRSGKQLVALRARQKGELVDTLNGMAEVVAYRQQDRQAARLSAIDIQLKVCESRKAFWNGAAEGLGLLVMNGAVFWILWMGISLVGKGQMEGVYLAVVVLAAQSSFEAVLPLPLAVHYLSEGKAAAKRLFAIADRKPAVLEPLQPVSVPEEFSLEFEKLNFRYQPEGTLVLEDISLSLPAGSKVALVGPSGAGKSTLVQVLLRFWEYEEGSVRLGGRELRQIPGEEVRCCFSVVSQKTHIFNASIRDNILLARPAASQAEVEWAAEQAGLSQYIASLPEGLDSMAGNNGQAMSGGQRQRIAIARAVLKNAPILILDEPTAGLDAVTERTVMETLYRLMEGKTVLWITHRLIGLENMDDIWVMSKGKIAEQGSFRQLLKERGLFARMWQLQRDVLD